MGESGPTQGAERHADQIERWQSRPWLARMLRVSIIVAPIVLSLAFTSVAGRLLPPERLGVHRWVWVGLLFIAANFVLMGVSRLVKRFTPLVALMRLSLVFPDHAPSRTRSALRQSNSRTMLREMEEARVRGDDTGETRSGDYLVQLLKELNDHDRLTRGHSERVRAYSELIGEEIGLDDDELHKLRWAALLHDVGKLTVPSEILNKDGKPTDEEWQTLRGHPGAGLPMLEPLRPWLGDWIHAADQHHCRWDGKGYPSSLAGKDITLAGRIVAIADAYDVMTSSRSYKKPLSAELARQELTVCAGAQFDPDLVKAFLRVGLGRVKSATGPVAWIANLTGSAQIPVPATTALTSVAASTATAAVTVAAAVVGGIVPVAAPPRDLAFADVAVVIDDAEVSVVTGAAIVIEVRAEGGTGPISFTWTDPDHGTVFAADVDEGADTETEPDQVGSGANRTIELTYVSDGGHVGRDGFVVDGCDGLGVCDSAEVTIEVLAAGGAATPTAPAIAAASPTPSRSPRPTPTPLPTPTPTSPLPSPLPTPSPSPTPLPSPPPLSSPDLPVSAMDDTATTPEDTVVTIDVIANDRDPEGERVVLSSVGAADHGDVEIVGTRVRYTPALDFNGTDRFTYRTSDGTTAAVTAAVTVTVTPVNDPPVATVPGAQIPENSPAGTFVTRVAASDVDNDPLTITITGGNSRGWFRVAADGTVTVAPGATPDHEVQGSTTLQFLVDDGTDPISVSALVNIVDVNDAPTATGDALVVMRGFAATTVDVRANDTDQDGDPLTVVAVGAAGAGAVTNNGDGTITYVHDGSAGTTDAFTYTVADPDGASATATVGVTVLNFDDFDAIASATDNCPATFNPDQVDTDGDGTGDACDPTPTTVSTGVFAAAIGGLGNGASYGAARGDIDGDGDVDAVFFDFGPNRVARTSPSSVDDTGQALGAASSRAGVLVDLDGDGDLDLADANDAGEANTIWFNDGTGTFTDSGQLLGTESSRDIATADVDGDGDMDLIVVNDDAPSTIWLNDGSGFFSRGPDLPGTAGAQAVAVGDLNGDMYLDVVIAGDGEQSVWHGRYDGSFVEAQRFGVGTGHDVALGDLDGDGDLDVVIAHDPDGTGADATVWFNNGNGVFGGGVSSYGLGDTAAVAIGDLDGDGDLDLALGDASGPNSMWMNNGSGIFSDNGARMGTQSTQDLVLVDWTGDGDLDILTAESDGPNRGIINVG